MAEKRPICLYNGQLQELASADSLPGGGLLSEDAFGNIIGGTSAADAMFTNGAAYDNVVIGELAMVDAVTVTDSTIVGNEAVHYPGGTNTRITAFGSYTFGGHSIQGTAAIGPDSSAFGASAGKSAKGSKNSIFGSSAFAGGNTQFPGDDNAIFGYRAMDSVTDSTNGAHQNSVFGSLACDQVSGNCDTNTVFGYKAMEFGSNCNNNVVLGANAGARLFSTASNNVFLGPSAGPLTLSNPTDELWINNIQSDTPLMRGYFNAHASGPLLLVNGDLQTTGGVDKLKSATTAVSVAAATAPTTGQVLTATSGTAATWQTPSGGSPTTVTLDNGSVGTPSLNFTNDTDTGIYFNGSAIAFAYAGAQKMAIGTSGLSLSSGEQILLDKATAAAPGLAFVGATNTGWYCETSPPPTKLRASVGGTNYMDISAAGISVTGAGTFTGQVKAAMGSNSAPGLSFGSDTNTGIWNNISDQLRITTGGTDRAVFASSYIQLTNVIWGTDGSATAPTYAFNTDTNTGMFKSDTDVLGFTAGGTERVSISAAGMTVTGDLTVTGSITSVPNENTMINGNFDIWQRGTSFAAVASGDYTADRWLFQNTNSAAVVTIARSTDVPTLAQSGVKSNYSMHVDVTTADASLASAHITNLSYRVEGYDWARVVGDDITISFWVKAAKTGVHSVAIRNSAINRSYISSYTIVAADTWEKHAVTIPSDTAGTWLYTNGVGARIEFPLALGTTHINTPGSWLSVGDMGATGMVNEMDSTANNFRITQIKIEKSSTATAFNVTSISEELAKCQRYFQTGSEEAFGYCITTTAMVVRFDYPTLMRGNPTASLKNTSPYSESPWFSSIKTPSGTAAIAGAHLHLDSAGFNISGYTGLTAGLTAMVNCEDIWLSADL